MCKEFQEMKIIVLLLTLICTQVSAVSLSNNWVNEDAFTKKVTIRCSEEDNECRNFCGRSDACTYIEKPCRNCLGSNLKMTYVFTEIGRAYRNDGISYRWDHIFDLIKAGRFVSLTSKSIYNHVTRFNALSMRRRFSALCEDAGREITPIALFSVDAVGELEEPKYVVCGSEIYGLVHDPLILLNSPLD